MTSTIQYFWGNLLICTYSTLVSRADIVSVSIATDKAISRIDDHFVGVTIDALTLPSPQKMGGLNFSSEKVQALAKGLSPCYLRIGGTSQDNLTFVPRGHKNPDVDNTFTASTWDTINKFVRTVGWDFIFGLNALKRKEGHWDSDNAMQLIRYTRLMGYSMAGMELGNEPDLFPLLYNKTVAPSQLAKDFAQMKTLMKAVRGFESTMVIGPDVALVTKFTQVFADFLADGGDRIVDRITIHHYYADSKTVHIDQFTDPELLDSLIAILEVAQNVSRRTNPNTPLWLGETSSCFDGGAPGMSNRYVAGFLWLDKLGVAARMGLKAVIRQTFHGGFYAMIDTNTFDPFPDYWLTLVYKMLVGSPVLAVKQEVPNSDVRIYAHCTKPIPDLGYEHGSVTVYVLVLGNNSVTIEVPQLRNQPADLFWLTPYDNNLRSPSVQLNGQTLLMMNNRLPDIKPLRISEDKIRLQGKSFGFIVFPEAHYELCK